MLPNMFILTEATLFFYNLAFNGSVSNKLLLGGQVKMWATHVTAESNTQTTSTKLSSLAVLPLSSTFPSSVMKSSVVPSVTSSSHKSSCMPSPRICHSIHQSLPCSAWHKQSNHTRWTIQWCSWFCGRETSYCQAQHCQCCMHQTDIGGELTHIWCTIYAHQIYRLLPP